MGRRQRQHARHLQRPEHVALADNLVEHVDERLLLMQPGLEGGVLRIGEAGRWGRS